MILNWPQNDPLMTPKYVDPWDILNTFCFPVYAQKSLFIGENANAFSFLHTRANDKGVDRAGSQN